MFFQRSLVGIIEKYLVTREIIAVIGPRQAGKTTLINHILDKLTNVKRITPDDAFALNLFKNDIDSFIEFNVKGFDYLFIDEIQYAEKSGKQLKYIYDTQNIKIFIAGSSSAEISIQSVKYLVGRIFLFTLYPFSFGEFLQYKNPALHKLYSGKNFGVEINSKLNKYINEFILFGGYPRVVLSECSDEKITGLNNIISTLLLREVRDLFGIVESDKLIDLVKALALQIGNFINYSELSDLTGLRHNKLKELLAVLDELFICKRCLSFSKNPRIEISKNPKMYFHDCGLRNAVLNNFEKERTDRGALYENPVFSELIKKGEKPKYWRTKSGAEVDFVLNDTPIEIKTTGKLSKSLRSFVNKYSPKEAYIISETEKGKENLNGTDLFYYPFSKFI